MAKSKGVSGLFVGLVVTVVAIAGGLAATAAGLIPFFGPSTPEASATGGKKPAGGKDGQGTIFQREWWEKGEDGKGAWENFASFWTGK